MDEENVYERELGGQLLASVSRSFYLTLKALPKELREPISLAYLLARTADTIADTAQVSSAVRLRCLEVFGALVQGEGGDEAALAAELERDFLPHQTDDAEAALMKRLRDALRWLHTMSGARLKAIHGVLRPIVHGQMPDIQRFPVAGGLRSLETAAELEEYTWLVAGCVGEFWTELCATELQGAFAPGATVDEMKRLGANYGKGLQLVNILRDLGKDARLARCYLPAEQWRSLGVDEAVIAAHPERLRPVWSQWVEKAEMLLADGVRYVTLLQHKTLRYATALPVLLGVSTLASLRKATDKELVRGVKISRVEVGKVLFQTTLSNSPEGITKLARKLGGRG